MSQYPILVAPLAPIFIWIIAFQASLFWLDGYLARICIGLLAYGMLFAFAVTSVMLLQVHNGQRPSLGDAIMSEQLWRMAPRPLLPAGGWFVSIYLEQLFVTGLYVHSALPGSPLVALLLEQQLGRELPWPTPAPEPI